MRGNEKAVAAGHRPDAVGLPDGRAGLPPAGEGRLQPRRLARPAASGRRQRGLGTGARRLVAAVSGQAARCAGQPGAGGQYRAAGGRGQHRPGPRPGRGSPGPGWLQWRREAGRATPAGVGRSLSAGRQGAGGEHRRGDHQRVLPVRPVGHPQAWCRSGPGQRRCRPGGGRHRPDHRGRRRGARLHPGLRGQRRTAHRPRIAGPPGPERQPDPPPARCRAWRRNPGDPFGNPLQVAAGRAAALSGGTGGRAVHPVHAAGQAC